MDLRRLICALALLGYSTGLHAISTPDPVIHLTLEDCLFVKYPVPDRGIVCSNYERALRLSEHLTNPEMHRCAWGPFVVIGEYKGKKVFVACASVGAGSGLLFTELYVAGAKYILRYGSDDVKAPPESDAYLVKIIDEADNLYGFNIQSGVDPKENGGAVEASSAMVQALISTAESKGIAYETRICHHLENYHGLLSLRTGFPFGDRVKLAGGRLIFQHPSVFKICSRVDYLSFDNLN